MGLRKPLALTENAQIAYSMLTLRSERHPALECPSFVPPLKIIVAPSGFEPESDGATVEVASSLPRRSVVAG